MSAVQTVARPPRPHCSIVDLGRANYTPVHRLQQALVAARRAGDVDDVLLLVEHEPVITLGRSDDGQSLMLSREALAQRGVEVVECERGGKATYHGPGQLVGYPVIDLRRGDIDLHRYLRLLEEVLISALGKLGIQAQRRAGMTGVWAGEGKIASIGVAVRGWVTFHGFALNITCDLRPFQWFVPCGLTGIEMTSVQQIRPEAADMAVATRAVRAAFCRVFRAEGYALDRGELSSRMATFAAGGQHG